MAPKKVETIAAAKRSAGTPPASQRGAKGVPRKKPAGKKKLAGGGLDPTAEESAANEAVLERDMSAIVGPVQEIIDRLRSELDEANKALEDLGLPRIGDAAAPAEAVPAPAEAAPAPAAEGPPVINRNSPSFIQKRSNAMRIWKSFASVKLAEMASSLDAALQNDDKLRAVFAHVDADRGGSIDETELKSALEATGKTVSQEELAHMIHAADHDSNGDIDFGEFANVIKGVKASKAAFIIERGVRRHQDNQVRKALLSKEELAKRFEEALLAKTPKELLREWDRNGKNKLSRIEFRQGARDGFKLNFENKNLDEWFDKFDKDKDGNIDLVELKDAFKVLKGKEQRQKKVAEAATKRADALDSKIIGLEGVVREAEEAVRTLEQEEARLEEHRGLPKIDVAIGTKIKAKIKSAENPKAVLSFEDIVAQWDMSHKVDGRVDKEEFVKLVEGALGDGATIATSDIEAQFDVLDSQLAAGGSLPIKAALQEMIASVQSVAAREVELTEACAAYKQAALERQAAVKAAPEDFARREEEEAAQAAAAQAEEAAKVEAAKAAAAAKRETPRATPRAMPRSKPAAGAAAAAAPVADDLLQRLAVLDGTAAAAAAEPA